MPYSGQTNVTATCGNLYDPGGPSGSYASGAAGYVKIDLSSGVKLTITSVDIDGDDCSLSATYNDYLRIYNGPNTTYPLLATVSNGCMPTLPYTIISTGPMTLLFYSYNSAAGFTASWTTGSAPSAGTASGNATICSGNTATMNVTGYTSGSTFQWQSSPTLTNPTWTNIASATSASYTTPTTLNATKYYRVGVTKNCQTTYTSSIVTITVNPGSVAGTISPASTTICSGSSITLTLTGSSGAIQWQSATTVNGTYSNVGYTGTAYSASPTTTKYYRTVVTNGSCPAATSAVATVNVNTSTPGQSTWTGAVSTDWFNAGNWAACGDGVPTATTIAVIPNGVTNKPSVNNNNANCKRLIVEGDGTVVVNGNYVITVYEN